MPTQRRAEFARMTVAAPSAARPYINAFAFSSPLTPLGRRASIWGAFLSFKRRAMKQSIPTLLAGGLLALALFGTAGPLEDGVAAYQRGDHVAAMQILRPLAEQGDAAAQANLGLMYDTGRGVPQDYAEALVWYRKAADQGYAVAQFNLGLMYANGRGVPQDDAQAVVWYRKAAEQGDAKAQFNLGRCYRAGCGVEKDEAEAVQWFRKAADQGHREARKALDTIG
jgi:uncharacterized protein